MNKCEFEGCVNNKAVKGYCRGHYAQLKRGSELKPLRTYGTKDSENEPGRICTGCSNYKNWDDFYSHVNGINGRAPRCKTCIKAEAAERYRKG